MKHTTHINFLNGMNIREIYFLLISKFSDWTVNAAESELLIFSS